MNLGINYLKSFAKIENKHLPEPVSINDSLKTNFTFDFFPLTQAVSAHFQYSLANRRIPTVPIRTVNP
jgi:hypothetical protein